MITPRNRPRTRTAGQASSGTRAEHLADAIRKAPDVPTPSKGSLKNASGKLDEAANARRNQPHFDPRTQTPSPGAETGRNTGHNVPAGKTPAPKGTQNAGTAWAAKTGRAYDRRFRRFWRQFEGQTIGDGIEVAHVNRRLADGVQPDLVLIDKNRKVINIHDLTSQPNPAHLAKGEGYVKYFKEKYPGYQIEYTEGYWRGKENIVEALNSKGVKYFPGETQP